MKRFLASTLLVLALSGITLAGDIEMPPAPQPPPPAASTNTTASSDANAPDATTATIVEIVLTVLGLIP